MCVRQTIALVHVLLHCILFQHSVSAILCLYMFMGLLARVFEACSRVLFAGRRHGDVTVWYQSLRLQQWTSMGQEGATDRGCLSF